MRCIACLNDLNHRELVKIRESLCRRFGVGRRGNIAEIGFGLAEKNGRLDTKRTDAICFYVRYKRMPRSKVDRIPTCIQVRLKRGRKYVIVQMATDVIDIGPHVVKPTGRKLAHQALHGVATAGCIVAWKTGAQRRLTWGVMSVGHHFVHISRVPELQSRVSIRPGVPGTLIARSRPNDGNHMDAAIVSVERTKLVDSGLMPSNVSTVGKRIRKVDRLRRDRGGVGFTFPVRSQIPIRVARYLPISRMVPALGALHYVIEADSRRDAFKGGRSGSLWAIRRQVACMQHGGLPSGFARGWGQAYEFIFKWGTKEIAKISGMSPDQIDLRLIRII